MSRHDGRRHRPLEYLSYYHARPGEQWVGKKVPTPEGVQALAGPRKLRLHRGCVHIKIDFRPARPHIPAYFAANVGGDEVSSGCVAISSHLGTLLSYIFKRFDRIVLDVSPDADEANDMEYPDL